MVSNLTFETVNDKAPEPSSNGHILYFNIFKLRKIAGNPPPRYPKPIFIISPATPNLRFHYSLQQNRFSLSTTLHIFDFIIPPRPTKKKSFFIIPQNCSLSPSYLRFHYPPPPPTLYFGIFGGYFFAVFYDQYQVKKCWGRCR